MAIVTIFHRLGLLVGIGVLHIQLDFNFISSIMVPYCDRLGMHIAIKIALIRKFFKLPIHINRQVATSQPQAYDPVERLRILMIAGIDSRLCCSDPIITQPTALFPNT